MAKWACLFLAMPALPRKIERVVNSQRFAVLDRRAKGIFCWGLQSACAVNILVRCEVSGVALRRGGLALLYLPRKGAHQLSRMYLSFG